MQKETPVVTVIKVKLEIPVEVTCVWNSRTEQTEITNAKIKTGFQISPRDVYLSVPPGALAKIDQDALVAQRVRDTKAFTKACKTGDKNARITLGVLTPEAWSNQMRVATLLYPKLPISEIRDAANVCSLHLQPRLEGRAAAILCADPGDMRVEEVVNRLSENHNVSQFEVEKTQEGYTRLVWQG